MDNNIEYTIQKTAFSLFKEKGYKNVKIEDICAAVGITKSTFYYHFKSKESLLSEFSKGAGRIPSNLMANIVMSDDVWDILWASLTLAMDWAADAGKDIVKNVFIYDVNNEISSFIMREKITALHTSLILKGQQNGRFRNQSKVEDIYEVICVYFKGFLISWCSSPEEKLDYETFKTGIMAILDVSEVK